MKNGRVMLVSVLTALLLTTVFILPAVALPTRSQLLTALKNAIAEENGGFGSNVWLTLVDRDGIVVQVMFTGKTRNDQWPAGRLESAQKAYTANGFSLPTQALSTANLYAPVQPGGIFFGLQFSNPVETFNVPQGGLSNFGTTTDTLINRKIGGVSGLGGGLTLYDRTGKLVGAIGVSGDSSCADHNIAWKVRHAVGFDFVPGGVSPTHDDNIIYDITSGVSASGWGHVECSAEATQIGNELPTTNPIGVVQ